MPKVSVVLSTYNNQSTIELAVNSILNQTFTDFELIIINDASTDNTKEILQKFSDARIIVVNGLENWGLPRRLNQGVEMARGEYIARMDGDDIALPERLQKQVEFLDNNPDVDLLATRAMIFNNDKQLGLLPFKATHSEITKYPWHTIPMPHPTWMMRKNWVVKYMYREVWRAEDQDLLLRAHRGSKYACLPDVLLLYRQGGFNFAKTAIARRSLLRAQLVYFINNAQYLYAILVIGVFILKTAMDALCAASPKYRAYKMGKNKCGEDMQYLNNLLH